MVKKIFAFLLCISIGYRAHGQDHQYLEISANCENQSVSPFSKVLAIDNRLENQLLGYIQKGLNNRVKAIQFNGKLADSLANFFVNKSPVAGGQSLVFMLNELFMHEIDAGRGRLKLSVRLFRETGEGKFVEFLAVDSVYSPHGMDVTKKLLRLVNEQFCEIARKAGEIKEVPDSTQRIYSLGELYKIDSLEKLDIPMYTAATPKSGIYKNYQHFKMNTPDISTEMLIDTSKAKNIKVYRVFKVKNKKVKLETEGIYAVSDGNIILKATSAGEFYQLKKVDSDFYYERSGSFSGQGNSAAMMPFMYGGAVGGAIGAVIIIAADGSISLGPPVQRYRFRINHRRGNSIPVAVIEKAPRKPTE